MLTVRSYEPSDNPSVVKLRDADFPMPNLDNKLFVSKNVISLGDEIVAFASVRVVSESIMFFKKDLSRKYKVLALRAMVEKLKSELKIYGLDQCISFTDIPEPLMKHFGFTVDESPTKVRLSV